MEPPDRAPGVGGVAFALCPLLCFGIPVLLAAGIGSGLALAIGGAVIGGVVLVALAVGVVLVLLRRQPRTCAPTPARLPADSSRSPAKARPAKPVSP